MGIQPGGQREEGKWEGIEIDKWVIDYIKEKEYGGVYFWSLNQH